MKDFLIALVIVIILMGIMGGLIMWRVFYVEKKKIENPNYNKLEIQIKCEELGGLYFRGGFGTSRCDFPPK